MKYCSFNFCSSVDNSAGFKMIYYKQDGRMLSLCFPCIGSRQIYITQQSAAVVASTSRMLLLGDDVERILEETLSDRENSLFDSDDDSSVIEDLPIHEAIAIKGRENEYIDSAQDSTSALQVGASVNSIYMGGNG
jgi:hypothetical protein